MAVTDVHVAALRAYLTDDFEEHERLVAPLVRANDTDYPALLGGAFYEAARRRFPSTWRPSDVIRYVATMRARYDEDATRIDPDAAERLIRHVLGDESARVHELDDMAKATQVLLLRELIADEALDDAGLDEFLARSRARAEVLSR